MTAWSDLLRNCPLCGRRAADTRAFRFGGVEFMRFDCTACGRLWTDAQTLHEFEQLDGEEHSAIAAVVFERTQRGLATAIIDRASPLPAEPLAALRAAVRGVRIFNFDEAVERAPGPHRADERCLRALVNLHRRALRGDAEPAVASLAPPILLASSAADAGVCIQQLCGAGLAERFTRDGVERLHLTDKGRAEARRWQRAGVLRASRRYEYLRWARPRLRRGYWPAAARSACSTADAVGLVAACRA